MEGRELNIVEQNTAGPCQFFVFRKLLFFFKTVFDFENPFIPGIGTFKNINNRTHSYDEY